MEVAGLMSTYWVVEVGSLLAGGRCFFFAQKSQGLGTASHQRLPRNMGVSVPAFGTSALSEFCPSGGSQPEQRESAKPKSEKLRSEERVDVPKITGTQEQHLDVAYPLGELCEGGQGGVRPRRGPESEPDPDFINGDPNQLSSLEWSCCTPSPANTLALRPLFAPCLQNPSAAASALSHP